MLDSAKRENPLVKQFSSSQAANAIQNFTPKVNAFDDAMPIFNNQGNCSKETLYERILKNKDFNLDLFQDSESDEDEAANKNDNTEEDNEDSSGPEEVSKSFKFNQDHCLHVFNTVKQGGSAQQNNQFEQRGGHFNSQSAYISLNAQSRAEYLRHVELIDLQLDLFKKSMELPLSCKRKDSNQSNTDSFSSGDALSNPLKPPQSLREIFQISNKNRKLNKQRKKSKLESCLIGGGGGTPGSNRNG